MAVGEGPRARVLSIMKQQVPGSKGGGFQRPRCAPGVQGSPHLLPRPGWRDKYPALCLAAGSSPGSTGESGR